MLFTLGNLRKSAIGIDVPRVGCERLLEGVASAVGVVFLQLHVSQLKPGDGELWVDRNRVLKRLLGVIPFALLLLLLAFFESLPCCIRSLGAGCADRETFHVG